MSEAQNAYMREWSAKNKARISERRRERLQKLKADPEAYAAFRESANERTRKYAQANREKLRMKAAAINHRYTPERGKELRAKYGPRYVVKEVIKAAKSRALKKWLPFDLTEAWYEEQFSKGCAATGLPMEKPGTRGPWAAHIDRINPPSGYVMANCRLVCATFNLARKNWSDEDVLRMAQALVSRNADA